MDHIPAPTWHLPHQPPAQHSSPHTCQRAGRKRGADSAGVAHKPPDGLTQSKAELLLLFAGHRARHKILPSLIPRAPRGQSSTKTKGDNTQKPPGPAKATSSGCSRPSAPTREGTKQSRSHQKPLGFPRAAQMSKAGLTQQVCCRWK